MTESQVRELIRAAIRRFPTMKAFAEHNDLSAQYVTDVMKGRREPAARICHAIGVERAVIYRRERRT